FGDEGIPVALGRGGYINIVVFRMVLHAPESTAPKGERRRLYSKIVAGQNLCTTRQRGDAVAMNRRRLEHERLACKQGMFATDLGEQNAPSKTELAAPRIGMHYPAGGGNR